MASADNKVKVSIRVRPLIQREREAQEPECWMCYGNVIQQMIPGTSNVNTNATPYSFDHIFDQGASTKEIYNNVVKPIVENSFLGFNGAVLCYGQTSSGKTFTLYGNDEEPGIISLTAMDLFNRINEDAGRQYYIRVGLLEVYNEKVWDLLAEDKKQVELITSKEMNGTVVPKDLEELEVLNADEMLNAAKRLQTARRVGETKMNKDSSRSHTIVRIIVESIDKSDSENFDPSESESDREVTSACLNLVDLAGSEKASQTGAVGDRFKEATYINKSLSALAQVVLQLSQASSSIPVSHNTSTGSQSTRQSSKYVSFRDSKLTRLLQSSLEGNAFISLICNVTPASVDETHSTLRFARTAKSIKVDPTKNLRSVNECHQYKSKITELERMLNDKTSEVTKLQERLSKYQSFRPVPRVLQSSPTTDVPDRRKTLCLSQLQWDRNKIGSRTSEFKHPSILKKVSALKSVQRSSSTTEVFADAAHVFKSAEAESPPKRKRLLSPIRKNVVDAETNTDMLSPEASRFSASCAPMNHVEVNQSADWQDQSVILNLQSEKSFLAHEMDYAKEELQNQVENLQKINHQLQEKIESLTAEKQVSEDRQNSEMQQLEIRHIESTEKQQQELNNFMKTLEDVKSELRSALEREEQQKAENCLLASKVASLEEDDDDLMKRNIELENEVASFRKALETVNQQLESEKTLNASLLEERETSRLQTFSETELQEVQEQRDAALKEAAELRSKLDAIEKSYNAAVAESETLSDAKLAVDDELLLVQETLDIAVKENQKNIAELKSDIRTLEQQLEEANKNKQSLEDQLSSHQDQLQKINDLTSMVQCLEEKLNATIENAEVATKAKLDVDAELLCLQQRLEEVMKDQQQKLLEYDEVSEKVRNLEQEVQMANVDKNSFEDLRMCHQEQLKNCDDLSSKLDDLETRYNAALAAAEELSSAKLSVDSKLLVVQQQLNDALKEKQEMHEELAFTQVKLRNLEEQLEKQRSFDDILLSHQEQSEKIIELTSSIANLEKKCIAAVTEAESLSDAKLAVEDELLLVQEKLDDLEKQLQQTVPKSELQELERQHNDAVAAAAELASAKLAVDDKLLEVQEQLNGALEDKQKTQEALSESRVKIQSLEEQLKSLCEERLFVDDLQSSLQEKTAKLNELSSTFENLEKKYQAAVVEAEALSDAKLAVDDELLLVQERLDNVLKEHQPEIDQLNSEVKTLEHKLEEANKNKQSLENQLSSHQDQLQKANGLTSMVQSLEEKLNAAVESARALSTAKSVVDGELLCVQQRLEEALNDHQQHKLLEVDQNIVTVQTLEQELEKVKTEKSVLEDELLTLQEQSKNSADSASKLEDLERRYMDALATADELSSAKQTVDEMLLVVQEQLNEAVQDKRQKQEKLDEFQTKITSLHEELVKMTDEKRSLNDLVSSQKDQSAKLEELTSIILDIQKKYEASVAESETLADAKLAVDDELLLVQETLDNAVKEHQQNIDELNTDIRTLEQQLEEANKNKQSLEDQLSSHQDQLQKINDLTSMVQCLEEKLNAAIENVEVISKAKLAVDGELLCMQQSLDDVMKDQQQKLVEYNEFSEKVRNLEQELDKLKTEKSSIEDELVTSQEQAKNSTSKLEDLERRYMDALAAADELSSAKQTVDDMLLVVQEQLNEAVQDKRQKQEELEDFQAKISSLQEELVNMTDERRSLHHQLISQKDQSKKLDELNSTILSLEKKYEAAVANVETLSVAKLAIENELLLVEGKVDKAAKEKEDRAQESNRLQCKIRSLEEQVVRLDDLMRSQQQEQEYRAASHESVVSNLNHRLKGLQDELDSAQLEKKVVVDEYARLQTSQKDLHEKLAALEESKRAMQTSHSLELAKHLDDLKLAHSQVGFWKNKSEESFSALEAGTEYRTSLEKKLSSHQKELEKAHQAIEALKSNESSLREDLANLERIKEDLESTRKVKKRSIDCQTGSIDIFKQKNYYETEAIRATKKLKELDTVTKKEIALKTQQIKELTTQLDKVQPQITQLQESLVVYRTQAEENKPVPRPQTVSTEVQVDTLRDSLHRLVRGQRSELPKGYPDVYSAMKDYERTKAEVAILESWKRRCECNMKDVNKSNMPVSTYRPVGCIPPHSVSSAILRRPETTPKTTDNPSPVARRTRSQVDSIGGVDSCPSPSVRFGVNLKPMTLTPSRDPQNLLPSSAKRIRNDAQSPAPIRTYYTRSASAPSASTADTEGESSENGMSEIERLTFAYIGS